MHGFAAALGARLGAPHGAVCAAVLAPAAAVNLRAVRERGTEDTVLRMTELAVLLTGSVDAEPEDVALWLGDLAQALGVPGLASYGLGPADTTEVVTATQRASSMRGNPIELTDAEVTEILDRAR